MAGLESLYNDWVKGRKAAKQPVTPQDWLSFVSSSFGFGDVNVGGKLAPGTTGGSAAPGGTGSTGGAGTTGGTGFRSRVTFDKSRYDTLEDSDDAAGRHYTADPAKGKKIGDPKNHLDWSGGKPAGYFWQGGKLHLPFRRPTSMRDGEGEAPDLDPQWGEDYQAMLNDPRIGDAIDAIDKAMGLAHQPDHNGQTAAQRLGRPDPRFEDPGFRVASFLMWSANQGPYQVEANKGKPGTYINPDKIRDPIEYAYFLKLPGFEQRPSDKNDYYSKPNRLIGNTPDQDWQSTDADNPYRHYVTQTGVNQTAGWQNDQRALVEARDAFASGQYGWAKAGEIVGSRKVGGQGASQLPDGWNMALGAGTGSLVSHTEPNFNNSAGGAPRTGARQAGERSALESAGGGNTLPNGRALPDGWVYDPGTNTVKTDAGGEYPLTADGEIDWTGGKSSPDGKPPPKDGNPAKESGGNPMDGISDFDALDRAALIKIATDKLKLIEIPESEQRIASQKIADEIAKGNFNINVAKILSDMGRADLAMELEQAEFEETKRKNQADERRLMAELTGFVPGSFDAGAFRDRMMKEFTTGPSAQELYSGVMDAFSQKPPVDPGSLYDQIVQRFQPMINAGLRPTEQEWAQVASELGVPPQMASQLAATWYQHAASGGPTGRDAFLGLAGNVMGGLQGRPDVTEWARVAKELGLSEDVATQLAQDWYTHASQGGDTSEGAFLNFAQNYKLQEYQRPNLEQWQAQAIAAGVPPDQAAKFAQAVYTLAERTGKAPSAEDIAGIASSLGIGNTPTLARTIAEWENQLAWQNASTGMFNAETGRMSDMGNLAANMYGQETQRMTNMGQLANDVMRQMADYQRDSKNWLAAANYNENAKALYNPYQNAPDFVGMAMQDRLLPHYQPFIDNAMGQTVRPFSDFMPNPGTGFPGALPGSATGYPTGPVYPNNLPMSGAPAAGANQPGGGPLQGTNWGTPGQFGENQPLGLPIPMNKSQQLAGSVQPVGGMLDQHQGATKQFDVMPGTLPGDLTKTQDIHWYKQPVEPGGGGMLDMRYKQPAPMSEGSLTDMRYDPATARANMQQDLQKLGGGQSVGQAPQPNAALSQAMNPTQQAALRASQQMQQRLQGLKQQGQQALQMGQRPSQTQQVLQGRTDMQQMGQGGFGGRWQSGFRQPNVNKSPGAQAAWSQAGQLAGGTDPLKKKKLGMWG